MKKEKFLGILLTTLMVIGNLALLPASAAGEASLSENFDSITSIDDLNGKTVNGLTWKFSDGNKENGGNEESHALENNGTGKALKVSGSDGNVTKYNSQTAEYPLVSVYSGLTYGEDDKELNLSLDVKLDTYAYYDLTLGGEQTGLAKTTQNFVSFMRGQTKIQTQRTFSSTDNDLTTYQANTWFTLGFKQQKLADGKYKKIWYKDGSPVKTVTDTTQYSFEKLTLSGGNLDSITGATTGHTYNFAIDNVKFWSSKEYSAISEKHIDTAAELLAAAESTASSNLADVEAGYGKPSGEKAIEFTTTENKNISPTIGIAPTANEDVIVEFDLLLDQPCSGYNFGFDWGINGTYSIKSGKKIVFARNLGFNQWNNMKFRAFYDTNDSTYKWSYYINGIFMETILKSNGNATSAETDFTIKKFWLWQQPGTGETGKMRIDDLCIKTMDSSLGDSYCKQDTHKVSLLDWTGIESADAYGKNFYTNSDSSWNASQYVNYIDVYDSTSNPDNVVSNIGGGKTSDDKVLKMGRTAGADAVGMRLTFDTQYELIPDFKPGSTVRFGTSLLLGDNWLEETTGVERTWRTVELVVPNEKGELTYSSVCAARVAMLSNGTMYYEQYGATSGTTITKHMSAKKWYRVEFEMTVGDGTNSSSLVNIYVDGLKVTEKPISLGNLKVTDAMLHVYANHGSKSDADKAMQSDFYLDDVYFEYVPAGEKAYNPIACALSPKSDDIDLGVGVIALLDKAETGIQVGSLEKALSTNSVTVEAVRDNGTKPPSEEGTNGAYLKVTRPGLPEVWYYANDLSVENLPDKVSVNMLCSKNTSLNAYIAIYNSDGSLAKVVCDDSGDDLIRASADIGEGQTYKVFLWNDSLKPYFEAVDSSVRNDG